MRNAIGQKIEVGSPVVLVVQGQSYVQISLGRVEKFSKSGDPQIRYAGTSRNETYKKNPVSPPITRYERLFVMTEEQYEDLTGTQEVLAQARADWKAQYNEKFCPREWSPEWSSFKDFVNAAMNAAGKEDYYE